MDLNGLNRCIFTITHTSVRFDTIQRKISGICVSPKQPVRFNIRRANPVCEICVRPAVINWELGCIRSW